MPKHQSEWHPEVLPADWMRAADDLTSRSAFVDLHLAAQTYGLNEIFGWFAPRYASVSYSRTHLFKALTYFEDAEREPMPDMLVPLDWAAVKQYFLSQVPRLPRLC